MTILKPFSYSGPLPKDDELTTGFSFQAPPSSDIWDCPPSTHRCNAPILYKTMPLVNFKKVRATFSATFSVAYEQVGLIILIHGKDGVRKWIKSGIEFTNDKASVGTVGKDRWPDWSIACEIANGAEATIEMVRDQLGLGVYLVEGDQRELLRELVWVFDGDGMEECWVGVYGAKPQEGGDALVVHFRDLSIEHS
jgi:uncharacterized protein